jgi:dihydroorotase
MDVQFEMLLRGGRAVEPASGRDGVADIAIRDNVIAAIEPASPAAAARQVLDV